MTDPTLVARARALKVMGEHLQRAHQGYDYPLLFERYGPREQDKPYLDAMLAFTAPDRPAGEVLVPREPTEAQWDGLARAIMMWLDFDPHTPRTLFQHLERSGEPIPDWLRNEKEMQFLDHVPSKGTRCVLIYRAMVDAHSPASPVQGDDDGRACNCTRRHDPDQFDHEAGCARTALQGESEHAGK